MDAALVDLVRSMQRARGTRRRNKGNRNKGKKQASPQAYTQVVEGQSGGAHLRIRAALPWAQALEVLRVLADTPAEIERGTGH
jgi:hypothetical protein